MEKEEKEKDERRRWEGGEEEIEEEKGGGGIRRKSEAFNKLSPLTYIYSGSYSDIILISNHFLTWLSESQTSHVPLC